MLQPIPDSAIVAALRRIDPGLTAEWIEMPGRWAVCHDVQSPGNFDQEVEATARLLRDVLRAQGYPIPYEDVLWEAVQAVRARRIVCYVTEDDGSYRELDHRVVQKLERMDYYRRNCGLRDWKEMLDSKARVHRERIERDKGDIWDVVRRDKVFSRQASDILWGQRPSRSVTVPGGIEGVASCG